MKLLFFVTSPLNMLWNNLVMLSHDLKNSLQNQLSPSQYFSIYCTVSKHGLDTNNWLLELEISTWWWEMGLEFRLKYWNYFGVFLALWLFLWVCVLECCFRAWESWELKLKIEFCWHQSLMTPPNLSAKFN